MALFKQIHILEFFLEQSHKDFIPHVELQTFLGHLHPLLVRKLAAAVAGLLAVHEAHSREDQSPDVPSRGPGFLMVVRETGTNGQVDLESSGWGVEDEFGGSEGVVLVQFEQPEVESACVWALEVVEAEVEFEDVLPCDDGVGYGFFLDACLFLVEAVQGEGFDWHSIRHN